MVRMTSGTKNDALELILPENPQRAEEPEALYALLEERCRRYTMGDSTSLPIDTAQRLLGSILYCLDLSRRFPSQDTGSDAPIRARWQAGVCEAKRIQKRAKLLLLQAKRTQPPLVNTAYCDTLDALPAFFAAYDVDFFAQEIPCSFDYPLCHPIDEALLGAEYLKAFLRRLLSENMFLRAFSQETLGALYARYYIDYSDLLVNLYLPAAEMATLCALAGEPVVALSLSQAEFSRLGLLLASAAEKEAVQLMENAADRALLSLGLSGDFLRAYLRLTARDLLVRLRAAGGNIGRV